MRQETTSVALAKSARIESNDSPSLWPAEPFAVRAPGGRREQPMRRKKQKAKNKKAKIPMILRPAPIVGRSRFIGTISHYSLLTGCRPGLSDRQTTLDQCRQLIEDHHVRPVAEGLVRFGVCLQEDAVAT